MERHDEMPSSSPPGNADIANHTTDSAAWDENARALPPNLIQLRQKVLVVFDIPELGAVSTSIFLQRPVGRGRDYKMDGLVRNPGKVSGVTQPKAMVRLIEWRRPWDSPEVGVGFAISAQCSGSVVVQGKLEGETGKALNFNEWLWIQLFLILGRGAEKQIRCFGLSHSVVALSRCTILTDRAAASRFQDCG